jgi:hypothetical protein
MIATDNGAIAIPMIASVEMIGTSAAEVATCHAVLATTIS